MNDLPKFQEHVRIKRIQAHKFETEKKNPNCTVMQMDFAMAYSCEYQDEIQSALWSRNSVNLMTVALYQRDLPCKTFLCITDSPEKGKDTIYAFVTKICEIMKSSFDLGDYFTFFTDGPSSEFKNKFMAKMLGDISIKLNLPVKWQYFATSHGKGVVDGIGGNAKYLVRQHVMARKGIVQGSHDFFKVVEKAMPSTTCLHMTQNEIKSVIESERPWDNVPNVCGISQAHCLLLTTNVAIYHTSLDNNTISSITQKDSVDTPTLSYNIGEWVIVKYDEKKYPGEITKVNDDAIEVSVMHSKFGQRWAWPNREDKIFYLKKDIVKKIKVPVPSDRRGFFRFESDIQSS